MTGKIVVGVDGSEGSCTALRWAIAQAAARPAQVQAVIVWQRTFDYGSHRYWPVDEDTAGHARELLAAAVAETAAPSPHVKISQLVLEGDPAQVLCERSADADLLVVGSRGLGGFADLIVGSVSTKCVHHSHCPVVIVPAGSTPRSKPLIREDPQSPSSPAKDRDA